MATGLWRAKGPPHCHVNHLAHVKLRQLCSQLQVPPAVTGTSSFRDAQGSLVLPGRNQSRQAIFQCLLCTLTAAPPGMAEEETEAHRGPVTYTSLVMTVQALCQVRMWWYWAVL